MSCLLDHHRISAPSALVVVVITTTRVQPNQLRCAITITVTHTTCAYTSKHKHEQNKIKTKTRTSTYTARRHTKQTPFITSATKHSPDTAHTRNTRNQHEHTYAQPQVKQTTRGQTTRAKQQCNAHTRTRTCTHTPGPQQHHTRAEFSTVVLACTDVSSLKHSVPLRLHHHSELACTHPYTRNVRLYTSTIQTINQHNTNLARTQQTTHHAFTHKHIKQHTARCTLHTARMASPQAYTFSSTEFRETLELAFLESSPANAHTAPPQCTQHNPHHHDTSSTCMQPLCSSAAHA